MKTEYVIPECNISQLEKEIVKLNKICDKLNLPHITYVVDGVDHIDYFCEFTDGSKKTQWINENNENLDKFTKLGQIREWKRVVVDGETPKFNGWTFVATLSPIPTDDGISENQIRKTPGIEINIPKEFRTRVNECDHCNVKRRRNDTYVVMNDRQEFKMVGSTCIKDFLGHKNPHAIASYLELLFNLSDLCETFSDSESWGFCSVESNYSIHAVLRATSAVVSKYGWVSKKYAYETYSISTASQVQTLFLPPYRLSSEEKKFVNSLTITDADKNKAEKIIEWLKSIDPDTDNEYLYNLSLLSRASYINFKSFGLLCSAVVAYDRSLAQKQEKKSYENSEFVGEKKQRLEMEVTVNRIFERAGDFGVTYIHHMLDKNDNYLIWFGTSNPLEVGETYKVKATVKDHNVYNGIKQTIVNRVKEI